MEYEGEGLMMFKFKLLMDDKVIDIRKSKDFKGLKKMFDDLGEKFQ